MKDIERGCECTETRLDIDDIIRKSKGDKRQLLQVLHHVQNRLGYIPKDIQARIAHSMGLPFSEVYGAVSFYSVFHQESTAKYVISSCQGTACYVRGAVDVLARLEKELGIKPGEVTEDGLFALRIVRGLGVCALAPVIKVNDDIHSKVNPHRIPAMLEHYRAKAKSESET